MLRETMIAVALAALAATAPRAAQPPAGDVAGEWTATMEGPDVNLQLHAAPPERDPEAGRRHDWNFGRTFARQELSGLPAGN